MGYRFNCFKEIIIDIDGEELIEIKSEKVELFFYMDFHISCQEI